MILLANLAFRPPVFMGEAAAKTRCGAQSRATAPVDFKPFKRLGVGVRVNAGIRVRPGVIGSV